MAGAVFAGCPGSGEERVGLALNPENAGEFNASYIHVNREFARSEIYRLNDFVITDWPSFTQ